MGTINYGTSDYITLGIEPLSAYDLKQDADFMKEINAEMQEYGSDTDNIDDYIQDYINGCMEDDYTNIKFELDKYIFYYFNITIEPGYYEGFYLNIDNNLPDELDEDERREAIEEVETIQHCLTQCAGMGLVEVWPGWCTSYKDYSTTCASIKKACDEMREEINSTPAYNANPEPINTADIYTFTKAAHTTSAKTY